MPKGYWIVRVDVKDEEPVKRYVAGKSSDLREIRRTLFGPRTKVCGS